MQSKVRDEKQRRHRARQSRVVRRIARSDRPRITVYRSSKHIYAQLVDGETGRTLATVSTSGVFDLRPLSVHPLAVGGLRALKIAKPDTGGYYYLSFRQASGYDATLAATFTQGVNVHRYAGSGYALTSFVDSLATGESFEDPANGLTVTQLARASDGSYATVEVSFGCVPNPPTVTLARTPIIWSATR